MFAYVRNVSCVVALATLAACGSPNAPDSGTVSSSGNSAKCLSRAYPNIGGPISLIDHTGTPVTEADFKGNMSVLYFGFTFCPDVCPLTLVKLKQAYDALPDELNEPNTLLISIDPERDTPEKLAQYITAKAFPEKLSGLTGSPEQIRAAADAFIADYSKVKDPDSSAEYTMDHTSLLYVMDENWQLKTFFTHEDPVEDISACLSALLQ